MMILNCPTYRRPNSHTPWVILTTEKTLETTVQDVYHHAGSHKTASDSPWPRCTHAAARPRHFTSVPVLVDVIRLLGATFDSRVPGILLKVLIMTILCRMPYILTSAIHCDFTASWFDHHDGGMRRHKQVLGFEQGIFVETASCKM